MTLVIAATGQDFVVLGTDSRGTITEGGTRVEVNMMKKLVKISDQVAILLYGSANQTTFFVERFVSKNRKRRFSGVTDVADEFASFCRNEARLSADIPRSHTPYFGFVIAGLDKEEKQNVPRLYELTNVEGFCLGLHQKYALQGKPMIGHYLFQRHYSDDLTIEQVRKLVAVAINETRKIDGDVGGPIRMATIDPDGFSPIQNVDVVGYLREWEGNGHIQNPEDKDKVLRDDEAVL